MQVFVGAGKMGNYTVSVYSPELVGTSVLLDHKLKTRFLLTIWKENKREKWGGGEKKGRKDPFQFFFQTSFRGGTINHKPNISEIPPYQLLKWSVSETKFVCQSM